jgi:uncharacterized protein YprB with RNaseH-like and TPR domain
MPIPPSFVPAAALRWQKSVANLREYEVVRDGNVFGSGMARSSIFSSEYERAQRLKSELTERYSDKGLESVFTGGEIRTESGCTYCIQSRHEVAGASLVSHRESSILSDLTLLRGIGPATARRLRGRGYRTITDLLQHPRYRSNAMQFLSYYQTRDVLPLMNWIGRRHHKSHHLLLTLAEYIDGGGFSFLDIETLGIFSRPIILLGMAQLQDDQVHIRQYLLRDIEEEPAALEAAFSHLSGSRAFVTFNGKSFDLPYLQERAAFYGMPFPCDVPHFDLLHFSRRRWKGAFCDCRLQTLERSVLGIRRDMDIPSALVPEFYESYILTGSPGPLVPIVEHNRQDVLSLVSLFQLLREDSGCR